MNANLHNPSSVSGCLSPSVCAVEIYDSNLGSVNIYLNDAEQAAMLVDAFTRMKEALSTQDRGQLMFTVRPDSQEEFDG